MKQNFQRQKKQQGFLSIEVIIVLVVILGLLALGASKMDMLRSGSDTTEEMSNIQALYASTKTLKSSTGYGASGTDLAALLVTYKGVPKNMAVSGSVISNLFGGTVPILSTGTGFTITENSVPPEDCIKLAPKISRSGSFTTTQINANAAVTGEVTPAVAGTQCTGSTNTLTFTSAN